VHIAVLKVFAFNFGWVVPVCKVDYVKRYCLNVVALPLTLMSLVALTWATNTRQEKARKTDNADGSSSTGDVEDSNELHVRGVGDKFESEEKLSAVFSQFGHVVQATVRHRVDTDTGVNTSWALVTMEDSRSSNKALEAGRLNNLPAPLSVSAFSQAAADTSTGAMSTVRKEATEKQYDGTNTVHTVDFAVCQ
jgi:hypothetical protein